MAGAGSVFAAARGWCVEPFMGFRVLALSQCVHWCAGRLKTWRATLQSTVEETIPSFLRLEDESRNLSVRDQQL